MEPESSPSPLLVVPERKLSTSEFAVQVEEPAIEKCEVGTITEFLPNDEDLATKAEEESYRRVKCCHFNLTT